MTNPIDDLAKAIDIGDSVKVQNLIATGLVGANARLPRARQPPALVHAAFHNRRDIVDILLRAGVHINSAANGGMTACHVAATCRCIGVLEGLLAHRPNLHLVDWSKRTALEYSLKQLGDADAERISLMLIAAGAPLDHVPRDELCRFAATSTSAIRALLARGVVVSELRDKQNATPLHLVLVTKSVDLAMLAMLVNLCGVDLEAHDSAGRTCAYVAACRALVDALRWFLQAGADVDCRDSYKSGILHMVHDYQCVIVLLAAGADVHARAQFDRTPLYTSVAHFNGIVAPAPVHALLACGADLDALDEIGDTPRKLLASRVVDNAAVEAARRDLSRARLGLVRQRAFEVCVGLQPLSLDALQMCEILLHSCGCMASLIPFHQWWRLATSVKHFRSIEERSSRLVY